MKHSLLIFSLISLLLGSCKKDPVNAPPAPATTTSTVPILTLAAQGEYGGSYFYNIGNDPLTILPNGDMIVSSISYNGADDKLVITRLSPSGATIWNKIIDKGQRYHSGHAFQVSTGEIISVATSQSTLNWVNTKMLISKLNAATGDTIWTRTYGQGYIDEGMTGNEDANGNYEIVDFSSQSGLASIFKISPSGDSLTTIVNTQSQPNNYVRAIISSDNGIILAGTSGVFVNSKQPVYICKYLNDVKVFESRIPMDNYDEVIVGDVCETSDGGYVVGGDCFNFSNTSLRYGFLLKVDANGNKVWEKLMSVPGDYTGVTSCVEISADHFILAFFRNPDSGLYNYDLSNLSLISGSYADRSDVKLVHKNGKLYRALTAQNAASYRVAKVRVYTIQ